MKNYNNEEWTMIGLANDAGFDKVGFDERVTIGREIFNKPWDSDNSRVAYNRAHEGFNNHLMYLDATNSGLQMYSVLTGDFDTGYSCCLSSGTVRTDAYKMIADYMNTKFPQLELNRGHTKKALMITLYASTDGAMRIVEALGYDRDDLPTFFKRYNLDYSLDDRGGYQSEFMDTFKKALYELFPLAMKTMDLLTSLDNESATYQWVMPDGFKVKYDVKTKINMEVQKTSAMGTNFSYHISDVEVYEANSHNRGMSPNIIHSFDAYVVRQMVRKMTKAGHFITTIHDAFATTASGMNDMKTFYNEIMCELLESDYLNEVVDQILVNSGRPSNKNYIKKSNTLTSEMIMDNTFGIS